NEKAIFEVAVPQISRADVVEYSLSELNRVLPFSVRFEDKFIDIMVLHSLSDTVMTVNREELSFSILSTRLNELYDEEFLFIERLHKFPDLSAADLPKDIENLEHMLKSNGIGISRQKINVPFLVIGE